MADTQDRVQRYIVLDTETTGLDPHVNSTIEIAAICFEESTGSEYPVEIARYTGKMSSDKHYLIDAEALQINGRRVYADTAEFNNDITNAVWQGFSEWLIEFATPSTMLVGHNLEFDLAFIIEGARRHEIDLKRLLGKLKKVDTKQVAIFLWDSGVINPANFRLITLWNYFFLDNPESGDKENPHNALQDAFMTSQLYFHMREVI